MNFLLLLVGLAFSSTFCLGKNDESFIVNILSPENLKRTVGVTFDGLGAVSGGGATSKLLVSYPEPYRSQILDYLFLPNFGASLHILKVEIGGDAQSTEGTEASHMHTPWEENYNRGYEWWLMKEAKKRNPYIILYGLAWGFPGWISNTTQSPYIFPEKTATYMAKWVLNAKRVHDLDINFVGIWNEREHNVQYIKVLRQTLDQYGLQNTKIAVADNGWSILSDLTAVRSSIHAIGVHYPGTYSTDEAKMSGLPLWSAEDYSTVNDDYGSGCLARILNQNYVNGMYTSTIVWNLIAAYSNDLPYGKCGLMNAESPWSGYYEVKGPIWMMAHTSQFTQPGWSYVTSASMKLPGGGSIVTLTDPKMEEYTFVLESMSHDSSICIRPPLPPYSVKPQAINIVFSDPPFEFLNMWVSRLRFQNASSTYFEYKGLVKIPANRTVSIYLDVDSIITLSTVSTARKGQHPPPPSPTPHPLTYVDDFESYQDGEEPRYLTPQIGSMEVVTLNKNKVLMQSVLAHPVDWCEMVVENPIAVMGNYSWSSMVAHVDFYIPSVNGSNGVFLGCNIDRGGCDTSYRGIFFWIQLSQKRFVISNDNGLQNIYKEGPITVQKDHWYSLSINVTEKNTASLFLNGDLVVSDVDLPHAPPNGFLGLGGHQFGLVYFDNLKIQAATK